MEMSAEDFGELPMRSLVALIVRCARRVEPWGAVPDDMDLAKLRVDRVRAAYAVAEQFCGSAEHPDLGSEDAGDPDHTPGATASLAEERGNEQMALALRAIDQLPAITFRAVQVDTSTRDGAPTEEDVLGQVFSEGADSLGEDAVALMFGGGESGVDEVLEFAEEAVQYAREAAILAGKGELFDEACQRDLARLVELELGEPATGGLPVDPTPQGPLGAYW